MVSHLENALLAQASATLAISGGRSPKPVFEEMVKGDIDWSRIHVFWVDERCVPPHDEQSNFLMADRALIVPAGIPHRNAHRVYTELRPDRAASRYVEDIADFFRLRDGELPQFDVVHLGVGADGHTASLFPGDPLIEDRSGIAAAIYAEHLAQYRVTLLPGVLVNAKHTVLFATGADKAAVIHQIVDGAYDPVRLPAQLARHARSVSRFMDEAAASGIG
jgi:6-phosphogluconolactonase